MVQIQSVGKTYPRGVKALSGVDIEISPGEVFALLGPNGAGKTTLVRILTTLLPPSSGMARVNGWDVVTQAGQVRASLGVAGQYATVDGMLTGFENLYLIAKLRGMRARVARRAAGDLLDRFRLADKADRQVKTYSGGMRRRLDLAAALVGAPALVVLDEPTTGLDPESRFNTWDAISELAESGTTILLTTQYLEEADRLADRITVIDHGRVVAAGTSDTLKAAAGITRLVLCVADGHDLDAVAQTVTAVAGAPVTVDRRARRLEVTTDDGPAALARVLSTVDHSAVAEAGVHRATLDDVFLQLTTRRHEVTAR